MISQALSVAETQAQSAIDAQKPVSHDRTPLREEFQTLVDEYAQETAAYGIEQPPSMTELSTEALSPTVEEPVDGEHEPEAEKGTFPGTWLLLLDLLESIPSALIGGSSGLGNTVDGALGTLAEVPAFPKDETTSAPLRLALPQASRNAPAVDARAVLDQVMAAIVSASGGKNRLVVRLHPPEMGTVTVKVTRAAGKVSVEIRTSDSRVQGMLARGAGELRNGLKMQGLAVDRFDVTSGENQGGRREREERRRGPSVAFQIEFDAAEGE